ncbi:MAG: DUF4328 domain-containing protein [Pirellulaceae bacterium]
MASEVNPYQPRQDDGRDVEVGDLDPRYDLGDARNRFVGARRLGWLVCIALSANVLLALTSLVMHSRLLALYWPAPSFDFVDADTEATLIGQINLIVVGLVLTRLVIIGFFLTWLYRVHDNLTLLGHHELDSRPVWAVLCWFVPILNLFCPYQVVCEIWRRSDARSLSAAEGTISIALVGWWWALWLSTMVLNIWGNYLNKRIDFLADAVQVIYVDVAFLAANIVAGLLLILITLRINRKQQLQYAMVAPPAPSLVPAMEPGT